MPWVVDTCVLLDIHINDPRFGLSSAKFLKKHLKDGLVICPITYVELSPSFDGDERLQQTFLATVGVQ